MQSIVVLPLLFSVFLAVALLCDLCVKPFLLCRLGAPQVLEMPLTLVVAAEVSVAVLFSAM